MHRVVKRDSDNKHYILDALSQLLVSLAWNPETATAGFPMQPAGTSGSKCTLLRNIMARQPYKTKSIGV